jgi:hypothetical protein
MEISFSSYLIFVAHNTQIMGYIGDKYNIFLIFSLTGKMHRIELERDWRGGVSATLPEEII